MAVDAFWSESGILRIQHKISVILAAQTVTILLSRLLPFVVSTTWFVFAGVHTI